MRSRRFKIFKPDYYPSGWPWLLTINGWDVDSFRSWSDAFRYLEKHWFCGCLSFHEMMEPEHITVEDYSG